MATLVEQLAPDQRVRLSGSDTFVGQDADERSDALPTLRLGRLDGLRRARVDGVRARVRDPADADDGVPREPAPLDGPVEDALEEGERAVDGRRSGAVDPDLCCIGVDRLAR